MDAAVFTNRKIVLSVLAAMALVGCTVTPAPLTESELRNYANDKRKRVVADQEPLSGSVGLYEAMARALKYNLDKQVAEMTVIVSDQKLRVADYSKLPGLVAGYGYADRSNYSGGSSVQIVSAREIGPQTLTSSSSSERAVRTADMAFSWNILDFGLSWIRAKQAADKVLIAEETRRRVANRIVEDVRAAYWRAVTADRLLGGLRRLDGRVRRALADTRKLAEQGDNSPLDALIRERELIEIQRDIRKLHGELSSAKALLAGLINVDPGQKFHVLVPRRMPEPAHIGKSSSEMVTTALVNRSELRETAYQKRINSKEAEAEILKLLPGVSFTTAPNWDSNQFLFNSNWVAWGARASWNLMQVFSYPARRAEIDAQDELIDKRALAVTMAVMTQVHVSRARLIHARRQFETALRFAHVQHRIVRQIRQSLRAGKVSEYAAIREEMNGLLARIKLDLAYVGLQSAFANVFSSMGLAPYDVVTRNELSVRELQTMLRTSWQRLGERFG